MESLNKLINAAEAMLRDGFDVRAFLKWQMLAFAALLTTVGPSSYYTQNFKQLTSDKSPRGLLAGEGILMAVREKLLQCSSKNNSEQDVNWGRPACFGTESGFSTFSGSTVRPLHC